MSADLSIFNVKSIEFEKAVKTSSGVYRDFNIAMADGKKICITLFANHENQVTPYPAAVEEDAA